MIADSATTPIADARRTRSACRACPCGSAARRDRRSRPTGRGSSVPARDDRSARPPLAQRVTSSSSFAAARSLAFAPRPRAETLACPANLCASLADLEISRPACSLSTITCALASPVRRTSVREIARTARPIERERSATRALALIICATLRPSRASARAPASASIASDG